MTICSTLKTQLSQIKILQEEFSLQLEKAKTGAKTSEEAKEAVRKAKELKQEIEKRLENLNFQLIPKEIKAKWINPETDKEIEISINIKEESEYYKEFYKTHLNINLNEKEIESIWRKNHKEIKEEIEKYGYDKILIIPENLPNLEKLNQKLIETMIDKDNNKQVDKTYQSDNFKKGGSFQGVKNAYKSKTRIILTKNFQNIIESNDPLIKATLNKNIMKLSGLSEDEVKRRMQNQELIPINFKAAINKKEIEIKAEGLSIEEYIVHQREFHDKTKTHLDEKGYLWLPKSVSASRVVNANWNPDYRQLYLHADDPSYSYVYLGVRLSRSFSG